MKSFDVAHLGQVFTPKHIVSDMLALVQNAKRLKNPRFLEPSCGEGAFFKHLPENKIGIEIDKNVLRSLQDSQGKILNIDFFSYPVSEKFDIIIGNPPYVRYQDISSDTKKLLKPFCKLFDERSNLYLFFIYKCILHLKQGGELVFITPRDFLKSTASVRLNEFIFSEGSIRECIDLGDKKIFSKAQPNCIIWRFVRGDFVRKTNALQEFSCIKGQILFTKKPYAVPFNSLFFVKVGAVSGADSIFASQKWGNMDFVCSKTQKSGATKKMIYGKYGRDLAYLQGFKSKLLERKIKKFSENNWWDWGRDYHKSELPRIYVNAKTRNKSPFFLHECKAYDGSILAIFPKFKCDEKMLALLVRKLNDVDWEELGFVCDGRFLFSQRSLENSMLDESFREFHKADSINSQDFDRI